ncbi:MAG: C40 family peptidase [Brumimicrobium sp.]
MKGIFLMLSIFFSTTSFILSQVPEFDKLEMYYDQGHYKNVYRKSKRLLDDPSYDFSYLPEYYLALSKLQLAQNEGWFKRHKYSIIEAKRTFDMLQKSKEGNDLLKAHAYEMSVLKSDLQQWLGDLKRTNDKEKTELIKAILNDVFDDIPDVTDFQKDEIKIETKEELKEKGPEVKTSISGQREQIISRSQELLGVPYRWAGDTPNGFDCSGFTSYLMKTELEKTLNRRAVHQYNAAKKVKRKKVKPGDFVFFDNGSGISHVGIIYSTNNNSIQMIHASTSVGISIVDIYESSYWKQRIAGFGTYFD